MKMIGVVLTTTALAEVKVFPRVDFYAGNSNIHCSLLRNSKNAVERVKLGKPTPRKIKVRLLVECLR